MLIKNTQIDYVGEELEASKQAKVWKAYFASRVAPYIRGDVLDVGAGNGVNAAFLAAPPANPRTWTFLEPDAKLAKEIPAVAATLKVPVAIEQGVLADMPASAQFDAIVYIDVLEHIEDAKAEVTRASSHLRAGGCLIILVPAFNHLYSEFDAQVGHWRRYTKPMLRAEVGASLAEEKLVYLDSMGYFASLANKLLLKKTTPSTGNILFWDRLLVPCSKLTDRLLFHAFGKSLIGIFRKE